MRKKIKIFLFAFLIIFTLSLYSKGWLFLIGGGSEKNWGGVSWSDKVYSKIVEKSNNGKICVLSVRDETQWIPDYFEILGTSYAFNLKVDSKAKANSQEVYNKILESDAVFIKGGDQFKYYNLWNETKTELAIKTKYEKGGIIAGTSAGAMVLSSIIFSAEKGSVYPQQVIRNPYNKKIVLEEDFFKLFPNTIVDTHFTQRGRLPRLCIFIGRRFKEYSDKITGIGIDDNTALILNPDSVGEVIGEGSVTIIKLKPNSIVQLEENIPPVMTEVGYIQMTEGFKYNFFNQSIKLIPDNVEEVENKIVRKNIKEDNIYLDGNDRDTNEYGEKKVINIYENKNNLYYGELEVVPGENEIPCSIIMSRVYDNSDFFENTIGGGEYAIKENPTFFVLFLDNETNAKVTHPGKIRPIKRKASVMLLDSYNIFYVSQSKYKVKKELLKNRQSVGIIEGVFHIFNHKWEYNFLNRHIYRAQTSDEKKSRNKR